MTALSTTKTASQLRMAVAACQLAPHLYAADCTVLGITPNTFDELSPAQQRVYMDRAEFYSLDMQGFLSSKARERSHRKAVVAHDIYDEFSEDACRVIEQVMHDAVTNYPDELKRVWREQASR